MANEHLKGLNPELPPLPREGQMPGYDSLPVQLELHRRDEHDQDVAADLSLKAAVVAPLVLALARLAARQDARGGADE